MNVATLLGQSAGFIRAIAVAHLLGPEVLGLWTALFLIFTYGLLSQGGLIDGMSRLVPIRMGAGRVAEANAIKDTAFTATMSAALIFSSAVGCAAIVLPGLALEQRVGIVTMAAGVALYQLSQFLRLPQFFALRYDVNRNASIIGPIVDAVLSIGLAPSLGIYALCVGLIAGQVSSAAYIVKAASPAYGFRIDLPSLRTTFLTGLPIALAGSTGLVVASAERIVAAGLLPLIALGYYGLGLTLRNVAVLIASAIANALYYRFLDRIGRHQDVRPVEALFRIGMLATGLVSGVLAAGILVVTNLVAPLLPSYAPGVDIIRIAIVGGFFLALAAMPSLYLVAAGRAYSLLVMQAAFGLVTFGGSIYAVRLGGGMQEVALVGAAAIALSTFAQLALSLRTFGLSGATIGADIGSIVLPGIALVSADLLMHSLLAPAGDELSEALARVGVEALAIAAVCVPVLIFLDRRTPLGSAVRRRPQPSGSP